MSKQSPLAVESLSKIFHQGDKSLTIFDDLNFSINEGEMVALVGASGAGKSTLLHILGLLDRQTHGEVFLNGEATSLLNDNKRTALRREEIGFVYQYHYLQPEFSALENVTLPQLIAGQRKNRAEKRAKSLLQSLGLAERLDHRPARLSGGEQQRVAIARALANKPKILLADEPTGNLDERTSAHVFALLVETVRKSGTATLIATHNLELARQMDRTLEIREGKISQKK